MRKLFQLLTLPMLLIGCADYEENDSLSVNSTKGPIFHASIESKHDENRTYLGDGNSMHWHAEDKIALFYGSTQQRCYQFRGEEGDPEGDFGEISATSVPGTMLSCNYALYPYAEDVAVSSEGAISFTLPEIQLYPSASEESTPGFTASTVTLSRAEISTTGGTFAQNSNPMMAVTKSTEDLSLKFKNLCGFFKLKLYGDEVTVKSVTLTGNNGEPLAGSATATMDNGSLPTLSLAEDGTSTLTLDCGDGVTLSADSATPTEFLFVIPAQTFTKGVTIQVTDSEGKIFSKSTSNEVVIERNVIQPMAPLSVSNMIPKPKNNEIWYAATAKVEPYETDLFGANILSNVWDETTGEGVIIFDGEVTRIGNDAFYECSNLTSITIPDSAISIGVYAFSGCSSLTSITIPDGVTSIGYDAFSGCSNLTSITIPDSVTSIEDYAFSGCSSLTSITIPDGVTSIEDYAFSECSSLTSVTIPDSVITIEGCAFAYCNSLTSITIPDGVTSIGVLAFGYCTSLTSITIPDGVTSIGVLAFGYCTSLTSITIPDGVTSIGNFTFHNCSSLTSVTIPDSVTSIGNEAFSECSSLTSVTIGKGVTSIGEYAFYGCRSLTSITIPDGVTSIEGSTFQYCSRLASITIPDRVTSIGSRAFLACSSLTSITIPDSVTSIGDYAFSNCSSLAEFKGKFASSDGRCLIVDGVLSSFAPAGLVEYTIPDSVTSIVAAAFEQCSGLTSITIPDSVTSIGDYAFAYCLDLTSVYCKPITPPTGGSQMLESNADNRKIYVPTESVGAYQSASGWSSYADSIVEYQF